MSTIREPHSMISPESAADSALTFGHSGGQRVPAAKSSQVIRVEAGHPSQAGYGYTVSILMGPVITTTFDRHTS